jgi:phosphoglycerate dehydrogenase-like enzyme
LVEVLITVPFSETLIAQIQEVSPDIHLNIFQGRRPEDIPNEVWGRIEVLYTDRVLPDPALVPKLRWIQFHFAGIDFALESPLLKIPDLAITTISGANASQSAEFALSMMMALGHHLPDLLAYQAKAEWPRDRWERYLPRELRGSTVGLIGYGSIGREIARLLYPFGANVLAVKKDVMHPEDRGYTQQDHGDPEGGYFTRLYPVQALYSVLKECDFIVITLPLTPETHHLISAEAFKACKPGAYLVDISRGGIVDSEALEDAIQEKKLGGAALDVFTEEPLPPTSPLWRLPNVIISPHIAGISVYYKDRAVLLFVENLKRFMHGTSLLNRFDPQRGY